MYYSKLESGDSYVHVTGGKPAILFPHLLHMPQDACTSSFHSPSTCIEQETLNFLIRLIVHNLGNGVVDNARTYIVAR